MMTPAEINKFLFVPEENSTTPVKESEAEYIYNMVIKHCLKRTLETGLGYARSACHIMAATGMPHIAIDPFQDHFKDGGIKNVQALGFEKQFFFYRDYSHTVLPALNKEGRKFDFIFIDGDHRFDGQFIDFYYADLMLEINGYILFHDTWMRSTAHMESYISSNRKDYQRINTGFRNLALFKKINSDERGWMHFKGFATNKSMITNSVIEWLHGKDTPLKKAVRNLKNKIK